MTECDSMRKHYQREIAEKADAQKVKCPHLFECIDGECPELPSKARKQGKSASSPRRLRLVLHESLEDGYLCKLLLERDFELDEYMIEKFLFGMRAWIDAWKRKEPSE